MIQILNTFPDPGLNWVQQIKYRGEELEWGKKLEVGSKLTLVVGDGSDGDRGLMAVNLIETPYEMATIKLRLSNQILGKVDTTSVYDLKGAFVYKQFPEAGTPIKPTDPINIWLTNDSTLLPRFQAPNDSLF